MIRHGSPRVIPHRGVALTFCTPLSAPLTFGTLYTSHLCVLTFGTLYSCDHCALIFGTLQFSPFAHSTALTFGTLFSSHLWHSLQFSLFAHSTALTFGTLCRSHLWHSLPLSPFVPPLHRSLSPALNVCTPLLSLPSSQRLHSIHAFSFTGPSIWNTLFLRATCSHLPFFKSQTKTHLFFVSYS